MQKGLGIFYLLLGLTVVAIHLFTNPFGTLATIGAMMCISVGLAKLLLPVDGGEL